VRLTLPRHSLRDSAAPSIIEKAVDFLKTQTTVGGLPPSTCRQCDVESRDQTEIEGAMSWMSSGEREVVTGDARSTETARLDTVGLDMATEHVASKWSLPGSNPCGLIKLKICPPRQLFVRRPSLFVTWNVQDGSGHEPREAGFNGLYSQFVKPGTVTELKRIEWNDAAI
jgi:hypothetical protein